MLKNLWHLIWQFGSYFFGYGFFFIGSFLIKGVMTELKKEISLHRFNDDKQRKAFSWYSQVVGLFDGALYITALLLGYREFIAVWLAFKVAGRWESAKLEANADLKDVQLSPKARIVNNALYNCFTIGNALALIYSTASWQIIVWIQKGNNDKAILIAITVILLNVIFFKLVLNQNRRLKGLS